MRRPLLLLLLLLPLLVVAAPALHALDVPPRPERWFNDTAGVVNATQAGLLDRKLYDFEQSSGVQFIIYIFPSLGGESMEAFTIRCVEQWKVGQRKYDNGVVLFVFVQDRKLRIETGYGTGGAITDAFSATVIRDVIAPRFRENDYYGGLSAGADAIIAKLRGEEAPVKPLNPDTPARTTQPRAPADDEGPGLFTSLIILFIIFFVIVPMLSGRRRRRSGCGGCFFPFFIFPGGGGGITFGGGGGGGFGGGGGGFGGGFEGGGGRFGGGGASGGW